jgi:hypothetical protein
MWGYQPHDQPGSSHPNSTTRDICWQSQQTSSGEANETRVRNMADEHLSGTDGFTSRPKEGVLRILSPLKSIVLGRVLTREPWVQW